VKRSRFGFIVLALVLSVAAFYTGARFVWTTTAPTHPLTGRPIAGIATDASWLERSAREQEEKPEQALQLIGIRPGMVVADVGAGTGYMTFRLAQLVGLSGKVVATDLQPEMLQIIRTKARREHIANVEVVQGTETNARLPEGTIDLALLVDVYHEFRYPQAMLQSIRRSLTPQGELILIEYRKEDPSVPIAFTHRMSVVEARREVEAEGFRYARVVESLPRQHIIVFVNAARPRAS
jgi:ubiquinone/menaquinone biosynthesis C-methylase UbiE